MIINEIYKKNPINFMIYSILIISLIIIIGIILFPSIFYDQWIWKYYWGPVVADAQGGAAVHNGIIAEEGYTYVSEISYGIILILSLFGIYKLIKKLNIVVDWRFALSLMPYIIFGPVTRTLEDTEFFSEPLVYWFISPLIYLQIAIYAIFFMVLGHYLSKKFKKSGLTVNNVIFIGGMIFLIPSLYPVFDWIIGNYWSETTGVSSVVLLIALALVFLVVGIVYLIAYIFRDNEKISVFKNPLNLAMLSGHLIDGITSYISIKDPFLLGLNYAEKHPASNFLLEIWGPLFPIVKFVLIMSVIFIFDVFYKDELKDYINLVNLLKIGILILGFSPGLRDLLRVTMGV